MLKRAVRFCLLAGLLGLLGAAPQTAWAWGWYGHELVAALAEAELDPAAAEEARRLLALEGKSALVEVANWADEVREEAAYRWSSPLHFVNFPGHQCTMDLSRACPNGDCVIGAIERFQRTLADPAASSADRLEALKFLVHFVGDIHQPLHAGRADDKGGNTFQTQLNDKGGNLHGVWDYEMLKSSGHDRAAYLSLLQTPPAPALGSLQVIEWAHESCRIVNGDDFYPRRRRLDSQYLDAHRPLAEARVRLAGRRLAALLNQSLPAGRP